MPYLRFRCSAGHQFVSQAHETATGSAIELDCRGVDHDGSRCERRAAALVAKNDRVGRTTNGATTI
jgi:hypothetical protein